LGVAKKLMDVGKSNRRADFALKGAQLYHLLGKGNRDSVKQRLIKIIESDKYVNKTILDKAEYFLKPSFFDTIKSFFVKNPSKGGLEQKATMTAITVSFIASLFFLSTNITGNVIGNLNQIGSNWIGGVLFVLGIVGSFIYFKRK
jgi:hypothetical protein|tara:strand:- start:5380 stop:5814 length:435 start_codon:yes stop_codon:yes gene_type:complete